MSNSKNGETIKRKDLKIGYKLKDETANMYENERIVWKILKMYENNQQKWDDKTTAAMLH